MATAYNEPKYQIEVSDFSCRACRREIECEATYYSAVFFEQDAFQRRDYCVACWDGGRPKACAEGSPEATEQGPDAELEPAGEPKTPVEPFAYWKARRPPKPADRPRKLRFDTEVVFEFFRRLGDASGKEAAPTEAERDDLRFVLALLLVRKKVLMFHASEYRDGVEWLQLPEKKDPTRRHWVRDPQLSDEQLERVKDRIGELLQMQI